MTINTWVDAHVHYATKFADQLSILRYGCSIADPAGLFCEFGVWRGGSINYLAKHYPSITFHGFDTFSGFPEDGRRLDANGKQAWPKGAFSLDGKPPVVLDNVRLYRGVFEDTLPAYLEKHSGPVAFLHVDCDLYSSTHTVLSLMERRIVPGTIIKFDEFWGFDNWEETSEARALYDWCNMHGREVECLGRGVEQTRGQELVLFRVTQ